MIDLGERVVSGGVVEVSCGRLELSAQVDIRGGDVDWSGLPGNISFGREAQCNFSKESIPTGLECLHGELT